MAAITHWESDKTYLRGDVSDTARIGPFTLGVARLDRSIAISREVQSLEKIPGLDQPQVSKLKEVILSKHVGYEKNAGNIAIQQLKTDLSNNIPSVAMAVATRAGWLLGKHVVPASFSLRLFQTGPDTFYVLTNIKSVHGLDETQTIQAISASLIALGELNRDIEDMNSFQAMTAMRAEELPLFQEKLSFLVNQINPEGHD